MQTRINLDFEVGQEEAAAEAVLAKQGIGLVCWEHHNIKILLGKITQGTVAAPHWYGSRFDIVLVLDHANGVWTLTQVPQLLLAGDLHA
jgi:hypothetical protein